MFGEIPKNKQKNTNESMANKQVTKLPSKDIIRNYQTNPFRKYYKQKSGTKVVVGQLINPQQQLDISKIRQAQLVPAELLYTHGFWETTPKVYQHRSEEIISCCSSKQQISMSFLSNDSKRELQKDNILLYIQGQS